MASLSKTSTILCTTFALFALDACARDPYSQFQFSKVCQDDGKDCVTTNMLRSTSNTWSPNVIATGQVVIDDQGRKQVVVNPGSITVTPSEATTGVQTVTNGIGAVLSPVSNVVAAGLYAKALTDAAARTGKDGIQQQEIANQGAAAAAAAGVSQVPGTIINLSATGGNATGGTSSAKTGPVTATGGTNMNTLMANQGGIKIGVTADANAAIRPIQRKPDRDRRGQPMGVIVDGLGGP